MPDDALKKESGNMSLRERIEKGVFPVITSELGPPKGTSMDQFLERAEGLKSSVHAVNVTDNQRSIMRLGSLPGAIMLKQKDIEVILQVACRDRNRMALQSDLLGASAFGIENVLALTGDSLQAGDHKQAKPVFDLEAVELLKLVGKLNSGEDYNGKKLKGGSNFFSGGVVNTNATLGDMQLRRLERKLEAGARFFQSQVTFSPRLFEQFMNQAEKYNTCILAGVLLVRSLKSALFLNKNVPGISISEEYLKRLEKAPDQAQEGVDICVELIEQLLPMCQGVHIMAVHHEYLVPDIVGKLRERIRIPE